MNRNGTALSSSYVDLPEALAWIATRDAEWAIECRGVGLLRLALLLAARGLQGGDVVMSILEAEDEIISAGQHDLVAAFGRPGGYREPLAAKRALVALDWIDMQINTESRSPADLRPIPQSHSEEFWFALRIDASSLVSAFPAAFELHDGQHATGPATDDESNGERQATKSTPASAENAAIYAAACAFVRKRNAEVEASAQFKRTGQYPGREETEAAIMAAEPGCTRALARDALDECAGHWPRKRGPRGPRNAR